MSWSIRPPSISFFNLVIRAVSSGPITCVVSFLAECGTSEGRSLMSICRLEKMDIFRLETIIQEVDGAHPVDSANP